MRALACLAALSPLVAGQIPEAELRSLDLGDGTELSYALVLPDGFARDVPHPTLLALPPGDQSLAMVAAGLDRYWRAEARRRGWVVVSPAAPAGEPLAAWSAARVEALLQALRAETRVEGRVHVAGPSNGGRAALRVACALPGRVASVTALPGFAAEEDDVAAIAEIPVRLLVGGADGGWLTRSEETRARLLAAGNGEVSLRVLPGEGHTPASLDGGALLFDLLDDARAREAAVTAAGIVLDELHAAASAADEERYFALFAPGAVFYGTDASERWTVPQFRAYATPFFEQGRGWTYRSTERHLFVGSARDVVWFDERLENEKYGEVRGSGALSLRGDAWLVEQYNLAFPVPNELAADLVARVAVLELARDFASGALADPAPRLGLPGDGGLPVALYPASGVDPAALSPEALLDAARGLLSRDARLAMRGDLWELAAPAEDHATLASVLGLALSRHPRSESEPGGLEDREYEYWNLVNDLADIELGAFEAAREGDDRRKGLDLLRRHARSREELHAFLGAAVTPASWNAPVLRKFWSSGSLQVRHSPAGHAAVESVLSDVRAALAALETP
jgi:dienelactone hydrolase